MRLLSGDAQGRHLLFAWTWVTAGLRCRDGLLMIESRTSPYRSIVSDGRLDDKTLSPARRLPHGAQ